MATLKCSPTTETIVQNDIFWAPHEPHQGYFYSRIKFYMGIKITRKMLILIYRFINIC